MEENKNIWRVLRQYLFEAFVTIAFLVMAGLFLFDESFSKTVITVFLRPEVAFVFLVVFGSLSALLLLLFFIQARKKKLRSTKRKSTFAKTVVCSDKVREMTQTQAYYDPGTVVTSVQNELPDVDTGASSLIELYFQYEGDLSI